MRVEKINGLNLLCGGMLPHTKIVADQEWAPADGSKGTVTVIQRDGEWVTYKGDLQPAHTKDAFSFQSRYCLVLPSSTIPKELETAMA